MLLLVVLALLAIFALLGVAFVVIANQAYRSSLPIQRIEQEADPSQVARAVLLQQGLMQVLHGPTTDASTGIHLVPRWATIVCWKRCTATIG